jgi:GNAT superfamily N-acetyltransferase
VRESDIEELFDVRAATRENALSPQQLEQMGITAASIREDLAAGTLQGWVCLHDSRIVGFCMGDSTRGEVGVLAVLPQYERRGIGTALLSRVVDWLRTFDPPRIWLGAPSNPQTRAYGFYRTLGWAPTGETDAHGDEVLVLSEPARREPSSR